LQSTLSPCTHAHISAILSAPFNSDNHHYQARKGGLKMENAGNTPNASMEPFRYLVSRRGAGRLRRWLMSLVALLGLITATIIVIGLIPFAPDIPPAGLTNGNPGGGGLRRAFPEMKLRPSNQTTPEKVELGRLLYFDPVLSGDNEQSCATCHHP